MILLILKDQFGTIQNLQEDSLDSIPSPSPSVKIQIIVGKVYLK